MVGLCDVAAWAAVVLPVLYSVTREAAKAEAERSSVNGGSGHPLRYMNVNHPRVGTPTRVRRVWETGGNKPNAKWFRIRSQVQSSALATAYLMHKALSRHLQFSRRYVHSQDPMQNASASGTHFAFCIRSVARSTTDLMQNANLRSKIAQFH